MVIELDHVQPEQLLQNLAIPSCPGILDRLRALRDDSATTARRQAVPA